MRLYLTELIKRCTKINCTFHHHVATLANTTIRPVLFSSSTINYSYWGAAFLRNLKYCAIVQLYQDPTWRSPTKKQTMRPLTGSQSETASYYNAIWTHHLLEIVKVLLVLIVILTYKQILWPFWETSIQGLRQKRQSGCGKNIWFA